MDTRTELQKKVDQMLTLKAETRILQKKIKEEERLQKRLEKQIIIKRAKAIDRIANIMKQYDLKVSDL